MSRWLRGRQSAVRLTCFLGLGIWPWGRVYANRGGYDVEVLRNVFRRPPVQIGRNPKPLNMPDSEARFIKHVTTASDDYDEAATDLQQSQVVRKRNKAICTDLPDGNFVDWVGEVKDVGANGEGKAHVAVDIDDNIHVQTRNNAFSDLSDNTLMPEGLPFFDALTHLVPGDKVTISGSFVGESGSCVKTSNMTEVFGLADPQFIARFSKVEKK